MKISENMIVMVLAILIMFIGVNMTIYDELLECFMSS